MKGLCAEDDSWPKDMGENILSNLFTQTEMRRNCVSSKRKIISKHCFVGDFCLLEATVHMFFFREENLEILHHHHRRPKSTTYVLRWRLKSSRRNSKDACLTMGKQTLVELHARRIAIRNFSFLCELRIEFKNRSRISTIFGVSRD